MQIEELHKNVFLIKGDCREVIPELGELETIITDPPYGIEFISGFRKERYNAIHNDSDYEALKYVTSLEVKYSSYVFCRWDAIPFVKTPTSLITWIKNNFSMGDLKHTHARQTENILFYRGLEHNFPSVRPRDVVYSARTENKIHPTQKPLSLMQTICSWSKGEIIDPFMGSGTTGAAAVTLGRPFVGIELDQTNFDTACRLIEKARPKSIHILLHAETTRKNKRRDLGGLNK